MTRRVLIADDHEDIRELLRVVLLTESYTVVAAADGDEALELWRRERAHGICAVILDQRMPGLSGIEVASAIRAEDPDQVVLLLSAFLDADVEERARDAGIVACVPKADILLVPAHPVLLAACP